MHVLDNSFNSVYLTLLAMTVSSVKVTNTYGNQYILVAMTVSSVKVTIITIYLTIPYISYNDCFIQLE